jgi:hypothetical protein
MSMPAAWAACSTVWPGWAETFCPLIVSVIELIEGPPLLQTQTDARFSILDPTIRIAAFSIHRASSIAYL